MGNPRIHLASFWRRWWLLFVLAAAGGALAAYVYGSRATPTYEGEAKVLVVGPTGGVRQTAGLLPTYAEIVRSTPVLAYALRAAKSSASVDALRERVRGESDRDTRLITIRADDTTPAGAVALANGLAEGLRWYVSVAPASAPDPGVTGRMRIEVVERATSADRIRPLSSALLEFGALAGLFGALAFALIAEFRNPSVTDQQELMEVGGLPVLGSVNGAWPGAATSLLDPTRGSPEESAAYRRLATQIAVANAEKAPRSLVVVGAEAAGASSAVAAKLALALAEDGRRVVLADFEGDHLRRFFRIGERRGGGQVVKRSESLTCGGTIFDRFALRTGAPLVLALPRHAPHGLNHEEADELVTVLSGDADVLIVHAPPPSRSRGALTWARATEATVLVVRVEHTSYTNVAAARDGLAPIGAKLVGAVLQTRRG